MYPIILGKRYIKGDGLKKHKSKGTKKFKKAIDVGNILAKFEYGIRMKYGIDIPKNVKKGEQYIKEALYQRDSSNKYDFGVVAYKLKDYKIAAELFYDAYKNNIKIAGVSLAYMSRRDEIKDKKSIPGVKELLQPELDDNAPNAKINLALSLVKKFSNNQNWKEADKVFSTLDSCVSEIEWWYDYSLQGDYEGDLVLGWMGRHDLIDNYDNISFSERLDRAKKNGWDIPKWMFQKSHGECFKAMSQTAVSKE